MYNIWLRFYRVAVSCDRVVQDLSLIHIQMCIRDRLSNVSVPIVCKIMKAQIAFQIFYLKHISICCTQCLHMKTDREWRSCRLYSTGTNTWVLTWEKWQKLVMKWSCRRTKIMIWRNQKLLYSQTWFYLISPIHLIHLKATSKADQNQSA